MVAMHTCIYSQLEASWASSLASASEPDFLCVTEGKKNLDGQATGLFADKHQSNQLSIRADEVVLLFEMPQLCHKI